MAKKQHAGGATGRTVRPAAKKDHDLATRLTALEARVTALERAGSKKR